MHPVLVTVIRIDVWRANESCERSAGKALPEMKK
jgi:hypothetical protein